MKRNYTLILRALQFSLVSLLLLVAIPASSQVSSYTFAQSAGTFTVAAGGTVVASGAMANMDDNVFGPIAIPSFSFNGIAQTSIYISTNGYITFGSSPSATDYTCI